MSQINNNTFELKITPNKRKREVHNENNKENRFVYNNLMEVKSIADLIKPKANSSAATARNYADNPFEVIRKPQKKKNRPDTDDGSFVNPALNLNGPETVINPFEVKRTPIRQQPAMLQHCFENTGLNIRGEERIVANPYEIARDREASGVVVVDEIQGIENPGLEIQPNLAIGVPFTPTVGCRIDFKNMQLNVLTPCSIFIRQLDFSPIKKPTELTPKRPNLSIISEEAVDISKVLESYQLELESSKATKKRDNTNLMDIKGKISFTERLNEAIEMKSMNKPAIDEEIEITAQTQAQAAAEVTTNRNSGHDFSAGGDQECCLKSSTPKTTNENSIGQISLDKSISENPDVIYEEVDETCIVMNTDGNKMQTAGQTFHADEVEIFKNPAPFIRTYRRDIKKSQANVVHKNASKEQMTDTIEDDKAKDHHHEMFGGLCSSIRKNIRKLIHPNANTKANCSDDVATANDPPTPSTSNNILTLIRQSFRRKQPKQPFVTSTPSESLNDISIIDGAARTVFRDAEMIAKIVTANGFDGENVAIDELMRNKSNIRSSFRKSSRHIMRSVFKKNVEDYNLEK